MSELYKPNNEGKLPGQSAQEVLRSEVDSALDDYLLLLSRRGLDKNRARLDEEINNKRQLLIELTQRLNGQLEQDDVFSEKVDVQLDLAEKGIEIGKRELEARDDGRDNIEAIMTDMEEYDNQLRRVDEVLDSISGILENKDTEKEGTEVLIFELKTMIRAFMSIGGEIQRLLVSLKVDNKAELIQRQIGIMNDVVGSIKNFDETSKDKDKLNKMKEHFYTHFDEALLFYEDLRDLTK
jgi:hypothetical protein